MSDAESSFDMTTPPEGSQELNGKDASFRNAPMISTPRSIQKLRVRGALVPMGSFNEAFN